MIFINGIIGFGDRVTGEGVVITIVIHGVVDIVIHGVVDIVVHVVHVVDVVVGIVDQVHMVCDIQRLQAVCRMEGSADMLGAVLDRRNGSKRGNGRVFMGRNIERTLGRHGCRSRDRVHHIASYGWGQEEVRE